MKLSERIREWTHPTAEYDDDFDKVLLKYADEVAKLEGEPCSVCGTQPALLVDAKEKGTYWKCADCMFETIVDKMKLEAENEALGKIATDAQWCAAGHMDEWTDKELDRRINALLKETD